MSQRECAGSSETRSPVGARDPLAIAPRIASEACSESDVSEIPSVEPFAFAARFRARKASAVPPASVAAGVAQGAVRRAAPGSFRQISFSAFR